MVYEVAAWEGKGFVLQNRSTNSCHENDPLSCLRRGCGSHENYEDLNSAILRTPHVEKKDEDGIQYLWLRLLK
jgi:hypothetical protein